MKTKTTILKHAFLGFIAIGIVLAIYNFLAVRSLWLDEAMLSLSIVNKPVTDLLLPLDHDQVAPIGFLMIAKMFSGIFGGTDWSLRLFPLISFLASIGLFYRLSTKILKEKSFVLFSTALFALNFHLISYASEVKQYGIDVTFTILIMLTVINLTEKFTRKNLLVASIVGMVSVWFSNIAVIVLAAAGLYLVFKHLKNSNRYPKLAGVFSSWLASFAIYYSLFIHNHPTQKMMLGYWERAGAFLSQDLFSYEFVFSLMFQFQKLGALITSNSLVLNSIVVTMLAMGVYGLIKRKKAIFILLASPLLIHLTLSFFKLYPFDIRFALYLIPFLTLTLAQGTLTLFQALNSKSQLPLKYALIVPLAISTMVLIDVFPVEKEEIKSSLSYLDTQIQENDEIYVYYGSKHAFNFYRDRYEQLSEVNGDDILFGKSHRTDWDVYERDIKKVDNPVWILFSHVYWVKNESNITEEEYILDLFVKNNFEIIESQSFSGSSLYKAIPRLN